MGGKAGQRNKHTRQEGVCTRHGLPLPLLRAEKPATVTGKDRGPSCLSRRDLEQVCRQVLYVFTKRTKK